MEQSIGYFVVFGLVVLFFFKGGDIIRVLYYNHYHNLSDIFPTDLKKILRNGKKISNEKDDCVYPFFIDNKDLKKTNEILKKGTIK